jgi:hypothetical protein
MKQHKHCSGGELVFPKLRDPKRVLRGRGASVAEGS